MRVRLWLVVVAAVGAAGGMPAAAAACADLPTAEIVRGDELCLAIKTFGAQAGGGPLVVLLHGDLSDGGPADYIVKFASDLADANPAAVAVAMARPGYDFGDGATSEGSNYGRRDSYREEVVDEIAAALGRLRDRYRASRVVLVGHSGGAAIAGVIAGRHPGLLNAALLVSCPCDVDWWRSSLNRSAWPQSLSPDDFADAVPVTTQVVAVTGADDSNAFPDLAEDYVDSLKERGVPARFVEAPGMGHNLTGAFWTAAVRAEALRLMAP